MRMRKLLVLLSIVCVIFSSCSSSQDSKSNRQYTEHQMNYPKEISTVFDISITSDNGLRLVGFDKTGLIGSTWISNDGGESWTKEQVITDAVSLNAKNNNQLELSAYSSPDGTIFLSAQEWTADEDSMLTYETCYLIKDKKSKEIKIDLPKFQGQKNCVNNLVFTSSNDLIIEDMNRQVYKINGTTGNIVREYLSDEVKTVMLDYYVTDKEIYVLTDKQIHIISAESGETVEVIKDKELFKVLNIDLSNDAFNRTKITVNQDSEKEDIYIFGSKGLVKYDGKVKSLMEGLDTIMGSANCALYDFEVYKNEPVALVETDEGSKIFSYQYASKLEENIELSLYTLRETKDFNEAVLLFQREHPGVKVKMDFGISEGSSITEQDALKTLNTELMSGKGPDLICFDGIDPDKYIRQGVLTDLTDSIDGLTDETDLFENIANSYRRENTTCIIPLKFSLISVSGSKEAIGNRSDMNDLTKALRKVNSNDKDTPLFEDYMFPNIAHILYRVYVPSSLQKKEVTKEDLRSFYLNLKEISKMSASNDLFTEEPYIKEMVPINYKELYFQLARRNKVAFNYLLDMDDLQCLSEMKEEHIGYDMMKNAYFIPMNTIGINAKSENKKYAEEFIKNTIVEAKEASSKINPGYSINRNFLMQQMSDTLDNNALLVQNNKEYSVEYYALTKGQQKQYLKLFDSLKHPYDTNSVAMNIVMEPLKRYITGELDLDTLCDDVHKKLKLYLAEQ